MKKMKKKIIINKWDNKEYIIIKGRTEGASTD
jgi:hypothetical protein